MNLILKKRIILLAIFAGTCSHAFGQTYSLKISKTNINVDTVSLQGYETHFVQSYKEVKKAWWSYIKSRAVITNHLNYLDLKIPDSDRNTNAPLFLVSQLTGDDSTQFRTLRLGLRTHNLDAAQIEKIDAEVKKMLLEFKTNYFVTMVEEKIADQEKLSAKLSTELDKLRTSKYRTTMDPALYVAKENGLLFSLKQVDENIASLKSQLLEIK